jgi:NADH dehydrogenase [ubiquinone] 1 alpha subcomplex assembly factor 1
MVRVAATAAECVLEIMSLQVQMRSFSLLLGLLLMTISGTPLNASDSQDGGSMLLTDFTPDSPDLGWYVVNDNVMGGRSEGDFRQAQDGIFFAGRTNTNGGGFSSIRTRSVRLDLSEHAGIRLHIKGDGRRYTWRLATAARWRGRPVSYWADFETRDGAWHTVDIPFSSFVPRFRGYQLNGPELDAGQITGMGLMIYDSQDGPFQLWLASVHAYPDS